MDFNGGHMAENFGNMVQIAVLCGCTFFSLFHMVGSEHKEWTKLFYFFGSFLMGDVYWQVCILFEKESSPVSYVANLCWYTSFTMLLLVEMMIIRSARNEEAVLSPAARFVPLIGPVFTVGMAVFYMQLGDYVNNVIYAVLMGALLFVAIRSFFLELDGNKKNSIRLFCGMVILYVLFEYGAWTASCFYESELMDKVYVAFDYLMTFSFPVFIPLTSKVLK